MNDELIEQVARDAISDWLAECTDGRVSSHTITMMGAFLRWYNEYRVQPHIQAQRVDAARQALEAAAGKSDAFKAIFADALKEWAASRSKAPRLRRVPCQLPSAPSTQRNSGRPGMVDLWNRTEIARAFIGGFIVAVALYCIARSWVTWEWTLPHQWKDGERLATLLIFTTAGGLAAVGRYFEREAGNG